MAWMRCTGNTGGSLKVRTASGAIASFETNLAEPLQSVLVNVLATGGNGTPDNPNPINGYTEANITRCGVNLWELSNDTKYDIQGCAVDYINNGVKLSAIATYARSSYIFKVKPGQTYTLSYYGYGSGNFNQIYYNDAVAWNPQNYGRQILTSTRTKYTKTFTATSNTLFVGFYITTSGTSGDMVIEDFMLEVGNTATDFKPYNGQTYTIAFGQTVYGGVLDVTRGKLHVTHEYVDLGEIDWTYNSTFTVFKGDITGCINSPAVNSEHIPMCSIYEGIKPNYATVINNDQIMYNVGGAGVYVKDTSYTDASNFKTAMNGVKLVYELATPFDIDLTPEVISAVVGTNNVFAGCGETTVKYLKAGG